MSVKSFNEIKTALEAVKNETRKYGITPPISANPSIDLLDSIVYKLDHIEAIIQELTVGDGIMEVKARYSINGTDWHDIVTENDVYISFSYDHGTTWTEKIRIKGEQGEKGDLNTISLKSEIGCVVPFTGATPPNGCLLLDGSTITRDEYPDLVTYLVDENANEAVLPDYSGKFLVGFDGNEGSTPTIATGLERNYGKNGNTGGKNFYKFLPDECALVSHSHTIKYVEDSTGDYYHGVPDGDKTVRHGDVSGTVNPVSGAIAAASHENRPDYIVVSFAIRAKYDNDSNFFAQKYPLVSITTEPDPLTSEVGQLYYNSTSKHIYKFLNNIWNITSELEVAGIIFTFENSNYFWEVDRLFKIGEGTGEGAIDTISLNDTPIEPIAKNINIEALTKITYKAEEQPTDENGVVELKNMLSPFVKHIAIPSAYDSYGVPTDYKVVPLGASAGSPITTISQAALNTMQLEEGNVFNLHQALGNIVKKNDYSFYNNILSPYDGGVKPTTFATLVNKLYGLIIAKKSGQAENTYQSLITEMTVLIGGNPPIVDHPTTKYYKGKVDNLYIPCSLEIGQDIFIKTLDVPDLWVSGTHFSQKRGLYHQYPATKTNSEFLEDLEAGTYGLAYYKNDDPINYPTVLWQVIPGTIQLGWYQLSLIENKAMLPVDEDYLLSSNNLNDVDDQQQSLDNVTNVANTQIGNVMTKLQNGKAGYAKPTGGKIIYRDADDVEYEILQDADSAFDLASFFQLLVPKDSNEYFSNILPSHSFSNFYEIINFIYTIAKKATEGLVELNLFTLRFDLADVITDTKYYDEIAIPKYNTGQDIYVLQIDVPDFFIVDTQPNAAPYVFVDDETFLADMEAGLHAEWDGTAWNTTPQYGIIHIGLYRIAQLEAKKVILTGVLQASNNLSDVEDKQEALNNLVNKVGKVAGDTLILTPEGNLELQTPAPATPAIQDIFTRPLTKKEIYEDWIGYDYRGTIGWGYSANNGSGGIIDSTTDTKHQGIFRFSTLTSSTAKPILTTGYIFTGQNYTSFIPSEGTKVRFVFKLNHLPITTTQNFKVFLGFKDGDPADIADTGNQFFLTVDTDTNLFNVVSIVNGVRTNNRGDVNVVANTSNWWYFDIHYINGQTYAYVVNENTSDRTLLFNNGLIPTNGACALMRLQKTQGSTAVTMDMDKFYFTQE